MLVKPHLSNPNRIAINGIAFDNELELTCYAVINNAIQELKLGYNLLCYYPVTVKPATKLYPAIELRVNFFLCPKQGHFTKLKPWLISVKSGFILDTDFFAAKVKMYELWNRTEYNQLILMSDDIIQTSLKLPVIQRKEFSDWLSRNARLDGKTV